MASSSAFFAFCLMLVASFVAVMAIGLSLGWKLFVVDLMTVVSLLLLALLKNSERRAERAIQLKLNVIAAALLEQREGKTHQAHDDLKRAIGIEEQV
ncbi:low affinity iron permease family protein [Streptodolium elevatio]|uniref:Low affinity iron permease family protein n=1 Tax=Streptodolium elevatio TaxID=3157996 RepID=A0ABV3DEP0_9ACTN